MSIVAEPGVGIKRDATSPPLEGRLVLGAFGGDGISALAALDQAARRARVVAAENARLAVAAGRPKRRRRRLLTWDTIVAVRRLLDELARRRKGGTQ
jgi:hypothetical protein